MSRLIQTRIHLSPRGARAPSGWHHALLCAALLGLSHPVLAGAPGKLMLDQAQRERLGIKTSPVEPASEAGRLVMQGMVVVPPSSLRLISSPVGGLVEQVMVAKGDAVRAGQALLSLHAPQLIEWQREYQQALLQLKLAKQGAERDNALLAEGIIPASRAQASQHQLQIAQAAVHERAQLLQLAGVRPSDGLSGRVTFPAPARGTVVDVMVEPGQHAEPGAPLVKFATEGPLAIEIQVPVDAARRLRQGDEVRVAGCDEPARVTNVNTHLDASSQMLSARASWTKAQRCVWPQQRVPVEVLLGGSVGQPGSQGWLVPASAVLKQDGQDIVFVQRVSEYLPVAVKVLAQRPATGGTPAMTQISAKDVQVIRQGDQVVTQGAIALKGMLQGLGAQ